MSNTIRHSVVLLLAAILVIWCCGDIGAVPVKPETVDWNSGFNPEQLSAEGQKQLQELMETLREKSSALGLIGSLVEALPIGDLLG